MDHEALPAQRRAIEAKMGPVLVIAGPGAGKTFCLIERVNYLIEKADFAPARICAVTFTNKAAKEMRARVAKALGNKKLAKQITLSTFPLLQLW